MKKKKLWVRLLAALLAAAVLLTGLMIWKNKKTKAAAAARAQSLNTAAVEKRTITSELSSSGTLAAKDTYSITSMVEGEVVAAAFEEGDQVQKDQVLYEIDSSSMTTELTSAENTLTRSRNSYEDALEDYNQALSDYSGNTYKATESGYIKELYISAGDKVSGNTKLADLYSDDVMEIRIPFLSGEAAQITPGSSAVLTLTDSGEQVEASVKAVANREEALSGGRLVQYVTFTVANPGGLTVSTRASARVGEWIGSEEGLFEASIDTSMEADLSSSVEIEAMLVNEGDYVTKGTPVFRMTAKTADKLIQSYKDSLDKAQESVESAQSHLESTQDSYDNYTITAPISGQVITKTVKTGDKIDRSSSSSTSTLAVIYDLSEVTFEMSVDELDVGRVKVGQTVNITADAIEGKTFTGKVTNISLENSQSNGVTNYPVTVTLDEVGDLLPGMNVDGTIILDQVDNALMIPVDSLMRGNRVYVKDDSVTEQQGSVPAGFKAVEVETGISNDDYVQITSGLSEGDEIYVDSASGNTSTDMFQMGGMGGPSGMGGGPGGGNGGQGGNGRNFGSGNGGNRGGGGMP